MFYWILIFFFFQIKYFSQLEMFGSCSSSSSCSFILGNIERVFDNRWVFFFASEVFFHWLNGLFPECFSLSISLCDTIEL